MIMKIYQSLIHGYAREKKMILPGINNRCSTLYVLRVLAASVAVAMLIATGITADAAVKQKGYSSAEEAVKAFVAAIKANDDKELLSILGPHGEGLISSGDPVDDKKRRETFVASYDKKNSLADQGGKKVLIIGDKDWPFPIPLVRKGDQWFFDTKAGREEMLNRKIGENELNTIQSMLAIVDAEREYAMKDRDSDSILEYAQKFWSDPGKKNGLYWKTKEGEEPSPLGELIEKASAEGYAKSDKPIPYHGYYYRILKAQGKNATDGAYDYVVNGKMIGGFAVVAYPAKYGISGVMTFIVNHDGIVYQSDLGKNTKSIAAAMKKFDPDRSWHKVKETSMP